jgi:tRNA pseudouridine55 synthase
VHGGRSASGEWFGLLLLDKPEGLSSNRALQQAKRLFGAAKAGHGGSLDPLATGMLPVFFGAATRLAGYLLDACKTYRVTAKLGQATTTGDAEGEVTEDLTHEQRPDPARIAEALTAFRGEIDQVPPMFSALKRDGVPLYRLARSGVVVERTPRRVTIEALTLERYEWPALTLTVRCSKGTYVRTLVEDVAKAAGTVAHVAALRRLSVEPFPEDAMRSFATLEAAAGEGPAGLERCLVAPDVALGHWPAVHLKPPEATRLAQGQAVPAPSAAAGPAKIYDADARFIAIGTVSDGLLHPDRVFHR